MNYKNIALGFAVGVGIGATSAYVYVSKVRPPVPAVQQVTYQAPIKDKASGFRFHPALKFGAPQTEALRFYTQYVSSFDLRTKNPKWVLEQVNQESASGSGDRKNSEFFEDPGIESRFRNKLSDFRGSGYDRGHMAPAADHKGSQQAMDDTFSLSNISPQVGKGFNRDYWARFERFVKDLTKRADDVYIVTGPLWLPHTEPGSGKWVMQYPLLGDPPSLVSVPTHFFKVVLADTGSGKHGPQSAAVGAFVMPNAPIEPNTPLTAFVVPLESLETVAGAKFFPGFINDTRREALDESALGWQTIGRQQLKAFERKMLLEDQASLLPGGVGDGDEATANGSSKGRGRPKAALTSPAPSLQPAVVTPVAVVPKTVGGEGAVHLCEHSACVLPMENFWQAAQGQDQQQQQQQLEGKAAPKRSRYQSR